MQQLQHTWVYYIMFGLSITNSTLSDVNLDLFPTQRPNLKEQ